MKEELLRIENGLLPVKNKKIILDLEISRGECAMNCSVAPTEQAETVTFLSFCDLCSIIKRNYNQEGKNAFFER